MQLDGWGNLHRAMVTLQKAAALRSKVSVYRQPSIPEAGGNINGVDPWKSSELFWRQ